MTNKQLWITHSHIWKSESAFMSWIRGGIRQGLWNRHPVKLEFIKKNRIQIKNPNPRGNKPLVWGGVCSQCNNHFVQKDLEVDHREGGHSLKTINDVQSFIENIVFVTEDDLQLVCKPCHKIRSQMDRKNISFAAAAAEKYAIALEKEGRTRNWLLARDIIPASNAKKRRLQVIEEFKEMNDATI
jgi:5-methylcytosine-specific restriction endonuclease McrA